jgi:hypothetical protein
MHYHISILFLILCSILNNTVLLHIQIIFCQYIVTYPYYNWAILCEISTLINNCYLLLYISNTLSHTHIIFHSLLNTEQQCGAIYPDYVLAMHYHISILFLILCCILNNTVLLHIQIIFCQYIVTYPYYNWAILCEISTLINKCYLLLYISNTLSHTHIIFHSLLNTEQQCGAIYPVYVLAIHYHISI